MRVLLVFALVMGWCGTALAQLTPDEAYQKLQEKKKQEVAAAASQPTAELARPSGEAVGRMIHQAWDSPWRVVMPMPWLCSTKWSVSTPAIRSHSRACGICKYELKQYKPADQDLGRAYAVSSIGGPNRVPRQLIIASAAALVMNDNPMRAVKVLRETMKAKESNGKLDEELQNDLGIALSHVNAQAAGSPCFRTR